MTLPVSNLYLVSEDSSTAFPFWARFFVELGGFLETEDRIGSRIIVAVSLPARPFAACLTAFGCVWQYLLSIESRSLEERFNELCSSPEGSVVVHTYLDKNGRKRARRGILLGTVESAALNVTATPERLLMVQFTEANMNDPDATGFTQMFPISQAPNLQLEVDGGIHDSGELPNRNRGRLIREAGEFVEALVGNERLRLFRNQSIVRAQLVGNLASFRKEVNENCFCYLEDGLDTDSEQEAHKLGELLKVRSMPGNTESYLSEISAERGRRAPRAERDARVVIFDGPRSFQKWRHLWPKSHQVVLLTQTDSTFSDGVALVESEYLIRIGGANFDRFPAPPDGLEVTAFRTRIKEE